MQMRKFSSGPTALLTTTTTNILNPPVGSGGVGVTATNQYMLVRKVRVGNKTAAAIRFGLWNGATGANLAGTEAFGTGATATAGALDATVGATVQPNGWWEWNGEKRLDIANFIAGGASALGLTIEIDGELGVAG